MTDPTDTIDATDTIDPTDDSGVPPHRIAGVGVWTPRDRLSSDAVADAWGRSKTRGIDRVAVPAADEDALTMAITAARRALRAADREPSAVAALRWGTTTPPLAEEALTPRLGEALGVESDAVRGSHRGSTRAGTAAVLDALGDPFPALAVASDVPRGAPSEPEGHAAGAGAVGLLLTAPETDEPTGARVERRAHHASDYPGTRFREPDETDTRGFGVRTYDRAAFCAPFVRAVERLDPADDSVTETVTDDLDAAATTAPDNDLPAHALGRLDVSSDRLTTPVAVTGDTGAAGALLGLARAFERGADRTLLVGVGSGGVADAALVTGTAPVVGSVAGDREVSYTTMLRRREAITGDPPAGGGARVSIPTWRRSRAARYRLVAGQCVACGAVSFPGEGACRACHERADYERVRLPPTGEVVAVTGVSPDTAPPEFVPQTERGGDYAVGLVRFAVGEETVDVPLQVTEADPSAVAAGDRVRVTFRLVDRQDGLPRYGAKVRPTE